MRSDPQPTRELPERAEIRVHGTVQGVGFRPFVYRLALELGVMGEVGNDGSGVYITAWARPSVMRQFLSQIKDCPLPLARVVEIKVSPLNNDCPQPRDFRVAPSKASPARTNISFDAASCADCLREIGETTNRRYRYPFTNCTHCGPRLTIIRGIPYDRAMTSMAVFPLCDECRAEYEDPADRRFHAQPNACPVCGPKLRLSATQADACVKGADEISTAAMLITQGKIIAVKGLGGYHLVCDANSEKSIAELRRRKQRYEKALALMARDLDMVRRYCIVSEGEAELMQSPLAPIVILKKIDSADSLSSQIAPGQDNLGFMLPYTPLHHLLLRELNAPIVCTSGNVSEEPQCISNEDAAERLHEIADYVLSHNRDIVNRVDDSVVRFMAAAPRLFRRARGYAPSPVELPIGFARELEILALGAELKNTFCLIKDGKAILSQHIGDLEDARTFADFKHNVELYKDLFQHSPTHLALDLHPEYMSTKYGNEMAQELDLSVMQIQHHHAHIAACMAENGWALDAGPVIGVALDGLGLGIDGRLWGGEILLADYKDFKRLAGLKPVALLGGSQAVREPWRNTYAHLKTLMGWDYCAREFRGLELLDFLNSMPLPVFDAMLASNTNVPAASSCGRLFDAVAAALGICRRKASYEGQAAIELEASASACRDNNGAGAYSFQIETNDELNILQLNPSTMWEELLGDIKAGVERGVSALRFHNGLAQNIVELVEQASIQADGHGIKTAALSGGVFQNKLLFEQVSSLLTEKGYLVLSPRMVPSNDGGLSLGQAVVCAARLMK